MTDQTPKPGTDTGLPRVKITRRGGVNYISLAEPPKRRAKPAKGSTDADSLRAMFPYLVIPRPGVYQVRLAGRMLGKITAQPGTDAFGKEYASILSQTRRGALRDLGKVGATAAPVLPQPGHPLDIALLCELSNELGAEMGAFLDDVNNGPATRDLPRDKAWNPERMAKLREMQAQYAKLQNLIMTHPEAHTIKSSKPRTIGAKRRA